MTDSTNSLLGPEEAVRFTDGTAHVEIDAPYRSYSIKINGLLYGLKFTLTFDELPEDYYADDDEDKEARYLVSCALNGQRPFASQRSHLAKVRSHLQGTFSLILASRGVPHAPIEGNHNLAVEYLSESLTSIIMLWVAERFRELEEKTSEERASLASYDWPVEKLASLNRSVRSTVGRVHLNLCRSEEDATRKPFILNPYWMTQRLPNVELSLRGAFFQSAFDLDGFQVPNGPLVFSASAVAGTLPAGEPRPKRYRRPRRRPVPDDVLHEALRKQLERVLMTIPANIDVLTAEILSNLLAEPLLEWLRAHSQELADANLVPEDGDLTLDVNAIKHTVLEKLQESTNELSDQLNAIYHEVVDSL